ncbi:MULTISPECIES: hypothetical protein [unclassified Bradyrhizobium]|uniref:hypothetical protein n=1 Tax=unclassified Bradyrhizobium TaxID=2631580 RepID=UPI002478F82A|nr:MULTISPECIES: hypothetical protein [unclassified Bradyrhizobium]WGR93629.1 hypothetical protein MTX20_03555 [Bradyrhizobium sp. ISRA435]WGR98200.1 hypothetical protein MTX23_28670 [Bradyrhizobium sp. ISRA436]WGS05089.1 hypothetical protein MTX18_28685 [Bradyrhizobium sp. ISRA437]WGS11974.1 hypothetical protein MTX26_28680 [Bradyrhizobium sp. ISRA443]WGS19436.1 hypothetical protein MTX22_34450 [Bradyrhizobium sp. ISRA463]
MRADEAKASRPLRCLWKEANHRRRMSAGEERDEQQIGIVSLIEERLRVGKTSRADNRESRFARVQIRKIKADVVPSICSGDTTLDGIWSV